MAVLKPRSRAAVLAAALALAVSGGLRAQDPLPLEYEVKAAFLYNFLKFVEWPPSAFAKESSPISLCIYGQDPFGASLENIVRGERLGRRELVLKRPDHPDRLKDCHVLFLSRSEGNRLPEILPRLQGRPVLLVGESEGFLRAGGDIRFVLEESKVRFLISPRGAESRGLKISSKLLRLAKVTPGRGPQGSP